MLSKRLASIDALRGFDMLWLMQEQAGLILVIAAALHLPFQDLLVKELDLTSWTGITARDLIAPLFLFIVGLTLPLALNRRREYGQSSQVIVGHILRRTVTLILLGLIFDGFLNLDFANYRWAPTLFLSEPARHTPTAHLPRSSVR